MGTRSSYSTTSAVFARHHGGDGFEQGGSADRRLKCEALADRTREPSSHDRWPARHCRCGRPRSRDREGRAPHRPRGLSDLRLHLRFRCSRGRRASGEWPHERNEWTSRVAFLQDCHLRMTDSHSGQQHYDDQPVDEGMLTFYKELSKHSPPEFGVLAACRAARRLGWRMPHVPRATARTADGRGSRCRWHACAGLPAAGRERPSPASSISTAAAGSSGSCETHDDMCAELADQADVRRGDGRLPAGARKSRTRRNWRIL